MTAPACATTPTVGYEVNTKPFTELCLAATLRAFSVPATAFGITSSTRGLKESMLTYMTIIEQLLISISMCKFIYNVSMTSAMPVALWKPSSSVKSSTITVWNLHNHISHERNCQAVSRAPRLSL